MDTAFLFKILSSTFYVIGALFMLLMIGVEISIWKKTKSFPAKIFNALSMTVYSMYFMQTIIVPFTIWGTSFDCTYISPIAIAIHFPCRGIYFAIFIVKIYIIFRNSPDLQYSFQLLITLFSIVIIFAILLSVAYIYNHINVHYYDDEIKRCISTIPMYLMGVTALYDFSFNMLTLYLFIKKLRSLALTNTGKDNAHHKLQSVILKNTVLVVVSVVCSFTVAGIYGLMMQYGLDILVVDWIINSLCIAFMKGFYSKYYIKCCVYPNKCVNYCCLRRFNQHLTNVQAMNIMVNPGKNAEITVNSTSPSLNSTNPTLNSSNNSTEQRAKIVYESTTVKQEDK
eukprot:383390_1